MTQLRLAEDFKRLIAYVIPYRWPFVCIILCLFVESTTSLAIPWLAGHLAGQFFPGVPRSPFSVTPVTLLLLGLCAIQAGSSFGIVTFGARTAERLFADLRLHVYNHLQALPLSFYHQHRQGETLALLTRDVEAVGVFLSGPLLTLAPSLLTLVGSMLLMIHIDRWLGLMAACAVPLCFFLVKGFGRRLRLVSQQVAQAHATALAIADDQLRMLPVIKAFTWEELALARYRQQIRHIIDLTERQLYLRCAFGPLIQFFTAVGIVFLFWLAGQKVSAGTLSPESLISFFLYGLMLGRPMSTLAATYAQLQQARGAFTRLLEALQIPPECLGTSGRSLARVAGSVTFQGVHFAYPGRGAVIRDLHLHIAVGETVALTGPNGAGKSTLISLLMRFYVPHAGQILLDGVDIATISLTSLRGHIGLVTQHHLLFHGTIRDNLACGKPSATLAEMERVAQTAGAHDFITQLPEGYDTRIGDNGVRLSGGQQQRLCLARALLKDPPMLILDEATAMYDPEGERAMLHACREVLQHRTVLIITHHPASLALADRVVRLQDGAVCEVTTPRQAGGPLQVWS